MAMASLSQSRPRLTQGDLAVQSVTFPEGGLNPWNGTDTGYVPPSRALLRVRGNLPAVSQVQVPTKEVKEGVWGSHLHCKSGGAWPAPRLPPWELS